MVGHWVGVRRVLVSVAVAVVFVSGCGSDSESAGDPATTTAGAVTTTEAPPTEPVRVLVTNDDGIGAEGIAAISDALAALEGVEVTVVAPLENQSGSGGKTTTGELAVTDATTATGRASKAVAGFPADAMIWALDQGGVAARPDLVVSGVNFGQNIGPAVPISGTIGAARAAAARGIPALAVSQGIGEPADFPSAVRFALEWFAEHRDEIAAGTYPVGVTSLNVPTCTAGEVKPPVSVPVSANADGRDLSKSDCTVEVTGAVDDVSAFTQGVATLTVVGLG